MIQKHVVSYFPRFSARFPRLDTLTQRGCHYCAERLAYDHCFHRNIGYMDWAFILSSFDAYAAMPSLPSLPQGHLGSQELLALPGAVLDMAQNAEAKAKQPVCVLYVQEVKFGGPRHSSDHLALAFEWRSNKTHSSPYFRGTNMVALDGSAIYSSVHRPTCRHGTTSDVFALSTLRFNHYVDAFSKRCRDCHVRDDSIFASIQGAADLQRLEAAAKLAGHSFPMDARSDEPRVADREKADSVDVPE
ncbi:unnamed protein product [Symbiodinium natans]|uniref:Uncharacterized protein n=1 Tax=Symbiodinium natans TaxID=878477 RepID=A0A812KPT4_9DINO|nr:unnamed protein product [Symbiodinium natans]